MQRYEYKVVPAPRKGEKARGAKSVSERFGVALAHVMNDLAAEGWEYLRADTLPCEERVGLTGTATHFHNLLVFRRALAKAESRVAPPRPMADMADLLPDPVPATVPPPLPPLRPLSEGAAPSLGPARGEPAPGNPVVPFPGHRG